MIPKGEYYTYAAGWQWVENQERFKYIIHLQDPEYGLLANYHDLIWDGDIEDWSNEPGNFDLYGLCRHLVYPWLERTQPIPTQKRLDWMSRGDSVKIALHLVGLYEFVWLGIGNPQTYADYQGSRTS